MKERYLYGVKLHERELKQGFLSYGTLAKMFDAVLCNNITQDENFNFQVTETFLNTVREEIENYTEIELIEAYEENDIEYDQEYPEEDDQAKDNLYEAMTQSLEIYQYFIISDEGARVIENLDPTQLVVFNETLEVYVWCITHWGTAWDCVSTNCNLIDAFRYDKDDYLTELQEIKGTFGLDYLTADQKNELKCNYYMNEKNADNGTSYGELANINELVTEKEIEENYKNTTFSRDDFFCTAQEREV